jgi:dsRNA-specific ribonuclease
VPAVFLEILYSASVPARLLSAQAEMTIGLLVQHSEKNRFRSLKECIRSFEFSCSTWMPPGQDAVMEKREMMLQSKKLSDAVEALIGVVFEASGPDVTTRWLLELGVLPSKVSVCS